jgi:hypothetical protein
MEWLLFLPQLPASPSTLRVMVWRRMRDAGALGLQNGVWILHPSQADFLKELALYLNDHGADSYSLRTTAQTPEIDEKILARLRDERDEEYRELCEKCDDLLEELRTETEIEKFTFAELEETEEEVQKLQVWLEKIQRRDVVGAPLAEQAQQDLQKCEHALADFAQQVYHRQGVHNPSDDGKN